MKTPAEARRQYKSCMAPDRTREEVLTHRLPNGKTFYADWCDKMRAVGRESEISEDNALADYCILYWVVP